MTYQQQMKDPRWQKKRLEVLEAYNYTCQECNATDQELHVHHPFYKRGAMIWEYEAEELQCLCHKCHKDAHAIDEQLKKATSELCHWQKTKVLGYIDSMLTPYMRMDEEPYQEGFVDGWRGKTHAIANMLKRAFGD